MQRRVFLSGVCAAAFLMKAPAAHAQETLAADEAHRRASEGELILIDVRSWREWALTGVPKHAHTIWIEDPMLGQRINSVTGGDRDKPVALICASGMRSGAVAEAMTRHGYSNVYNVREGMHGSHGDPGWLRRGLPIIKEE